MEISPCLTRVQCWGKLSRQAHSPSRVHAVLESCTRCWGRRDKPNSFGGTQVLFHQRSFWVESEFLREKGWVFPSLITPAPKHPWRLQLIQITSWNSGYRPGRTGSSITVCSFHDMKWSEPTSCRLPWSESVSVAWLWGYKLMRLHNLRAMQVNGQGRACRTDSLSRWVPGHSLGAGLLVAHMSHLPHQRLYDALTGTIDLT